MHLNLVDEHHLGRLSLASVWLSSKQSGGSQTLGDTNYSDLEEGRRGGEGGGKIPLVEGSLYRFTRSCSGVRVNVTFAERSWINVCKWGGQGEIFLLLLFKVWVQKF